MSSLDRNRSDMCDPPAPGELELRQTRLRALAVTLSREADRFLDAHLESSLADQQDAHESRNLASLLPHLIWLADLVAGAIQADNLHEVSEAADELADTLGTELDELLPLDVDTPLIAGQIDPTIAS